MALLSLLLTAGPLLGSPQQEAPARLELPWVFGDHMVLQRDAPIAVWGRASGGCEVRVRLGEEQRTTRSDEAGLWSVQLDPRPASSAGLELSIEADDGARRFTDVLVGDVWLCAGQSNMDFSLARSAAPQAGHLPHLRLLDRQGKVGGDARRLRPEELAQLSPATYQSGSWAVAAPESAAGFSAVAHAFGVRLQAELGVPVGLIDVSVGGSTTEGWIPRAQLEAQPDLADLWGDYLRSPRTHPFIRERVAVQLGGLPEPGAAARHFFEPGFLYEAALEPLEAFGLCGALWYQGESNAHDPQLADRLFRLMVEAWRARRGGHELPLLFVQLPAMGRATWPRFREVQAGWRELPGLSMAVTIDLGHPTDVHPRRKRPVGERLAGLALADVHSRELEARAPEAEGWRRRGGELILSFPKSSAPVWAPEREGLGFEVAGEDLRFYPARARLARNRVHLTSLEVPRPVAARYAWAPVPDWGLVSAQGLPLAPFRTHPVEPLRVACVGDSITYGHGLEDRARETYPARLQGLLGDRFRVESFARSGAGVVLSSRRGDGPRALALRPEHPAALAFAPEVVVSNLGINDIGDWPREGDQPGAEFERDYTALVADYRQLESDPRIFLWAPLAPLFPGQRFHGDPREAEISASIARVARATGCATIDMRAPLADHHLWFPDHLHPDPEGAAAIAVAVHGALREGLRNVEVPPLRPLRLFVLTGQSNSLGTTADPGESDPGPGAHPADRELRLFWSNRSTRAGDGAAVLIGDSGGSFRPLQAQQGEGANGTFWGPEVGFARALWEAGLRDFAVVKASRGGGGNRHWRTPSRARPEGGEMYEHLLRTVRDASAALPRERSFQVEALLYLQGESDDEEESRVAGERLLELAQALRKDLPHARDLELLVAGIAAPGARRDRVRDLQRDAAERDRRASYVDTLDLAPRLYDGLHFDRAAKLEVGRRLAAAWLAGFEGR